MSNGKISDGTHNSAVDEEVDAGVGEEEEMGHGLRVQEVGGRVVDRVALDAAHLHTHGDISGVKLMSIEF